MNFFVDNLCIISQPKAVTKNIPELASKHRWWNTCVLGIRSSKDKIRIYLYLPVSSQPAWKESPNGCPSHYLNP